MKLSIALSALLLGSTLLLTGCGGSSSSVPATPSEENDGGGEETQSTLSTDMLQGKTFYMLKEDNSEIKGSLAFTSETMTFGEDTVIYTITEDGYVAFESPWEAGITEYIRLSSIAGDRWNMCFANDGDVDFENGLTSCSEPGSLYATEAAAQAAVDEYKITELSVDMLADKTLYLYGYNTEGQSGDTRMVMVVSADGSTCDIHSADMSEQYADDAVLSIGADSISFTFDGAIVALSAIAVNENGIYLVTTEDTGPGGAEGLERYPLVFAFEAQADNGAALLTAFADATIVTKEALSASPWYTVTIRGEHDAECSTIKTYGQDYTQTMAEMDEGSKETYTGTYAINNNMLQTTFVLGAEEHTFEEPVLALTSNFMITQWHEDGDETAPIVAERRFTIKQDAVDFATTYGQDCSNYFDQLEQP